MSVVILDTETMQKLRRLKAYAEANRFSIEQVKQIVAAKKNPVGDDPNFSICFPGSGCRLVLSVEQQVFGWCWHVSISLPGKKSVPAPALSAEILRGLDIDPADTVHTWPESFEGGTAVNFLVLDHNLDPERN